MPSLNVPLSSSSSLLQFFQFPSRPLWPNHRAVPSRPAASFPLLFPHLTNNGRPTTLLLYSVPRRRRREEKEEDGERRTLSLSLSLSLPPSSPFPLSPSSHRFLSLRPLLSIHRAEEEAVTREDEEGKVIECILLLLFDPLPDDTGSNIVAYLGYSLAGSPLGEGVGPCARLKKGPT